MTLYCHYWKVGVEFSCHVKKLRFDFYFPSVLAVHLRRQLHGPGEAAQSDGLGRAA